MADKLYHASVGYVHDSSDDYEDEDEVLDHRGQSQISEQDELLQMAPFKRLERICNDPDMYKRQLVGRTAPEALVSVADSSFDVARILLILNKVSNDPEVTVRLDLAESLPHICMTCHSREQAAPQLRPLVLSHLLPLNLRLLGDRDIKVRKAAQKSLIVLLENDILDSNTIEHIVCTHVVSLTDQEDEAYHMSAVELMSTMAPLIGPELTESAFVPKFLELCSSTQLNVRHTCATNFGDFCAVVSQPVIEKSLLPSFVRLTQDPMWNVRKACAQVIMSVSCACALEARKTLLAPIFGRFLSDENRWVRVAAFQTLGPFITTFAQPSITGLAYNNSGELVLVNPDGFEFKCPVINDSMSIMNCIEMGMSLGMMNSGGSSHKPPPSSSAGALPGDEDNVIDYGEISAVGEDGETGGADVDENYNYFQYWREPIPSVQEIEDDVTSATNLLKLSNSFDNLCSLVDPPSPDEDPDSTPPPITPEQQASHPNNRPAGTNRPAGNDPPGISGEDVVNHNHVVDMEGRGGREDSWNEEEEEEESSDDDSGNGEGHMGVRCSNDSEDMSPQIPSAASPSSGSGFLQHIVPQELIDYYVKMFHCGSDPNENSDLARHCAFSLPAVALTLGE
ncbi:hypothetical protein M8J75_003066 [Diaphorina citri]|nr:hypothetical protein M8J75_003066 [Diaphorina citri]